MADFTSCLLFSVFFTLFAVLDFYFDVRILFQPQQVSSLFLPLGFQLFPLRCLSGNRVSLFVLGIVALVLPGGETNRNYTVGYNDVFYRTI